MSEYRQPHYWLNCPICKEQKQAEILHEARVQKSEAEMLYQRLKKSLSRILEESK